METILPTVIVAAIVACIFVAIVVNEVRKRKNGQGSCACGGSCSTCGGACHADSEKTQEKK